MNARWYRNMAMKIRAERYSLMCNRIEAQLWNDLHESGDFNVHLFIHQGDELAARRKLRPQIRLRSRGQAFADIYFNGL